MIIATAKRTVWTVYTPLSTDTVRDVAAAFVDQDTGTLHFTNEARQTIVAYARGAWLKVLPA